MPRTAYTKLRFELTNLNDGSGTPRPIQAVVQRNGVKCLYSIGKACLEKEWSRERLNTFAIGKRVPQKGASAVVKNEVAKFNEELESWARLLVGVYDQWHQIKPDGSFNPPITPERFRHLVNEKRGIGKPLQDKPTFMQFAQRYVEERLAKETDKTTANGLKRAYVILCAFAHKTRIKLDYTIFDYNWAQRFRQFMFEPQRFKFQLKLNGTHEHEFEKRALEVSSVNVVMSWITAILNQAVNEKLAKKEDVLTKGFYQKETDKDGIAFDVEELLLVKNAKNFPEKRADLWEKVRILTIIGASTGLRNSDWRSLKRTDVETIEGKKFLRVRAKKTSNLVSIPLLPLLEETMEACNWNPPKLATQRYNEGLKDLCEWLGIDKPVKISKTVGGVEAFEEVPKFKKLSSHACRRFFIRYMLEMRVPSITIMSITGHTTEAQMMAYAGRGMARNAMMLTELGRKTAAELVGV